jgi:lipoyl(octanoyl) transferase
LRLLSGAMPISLETRHLGRITFDDALALQSELVAERRDGKIGDTLLLLEHEPVYTIGRTRDRSSLGDTASLPHPLVEINRGGQATYHGPGQLVGYPILDLRIYGKDLHTYLRALEEMLAATCADFGVEARSRDGLTGVWVESRKLASIGVGVRHWISMHGFAINIASDLSGFDSITPCGIQDVTMTSVSKESGREITIAEFSEALIPHAKTALTQLAIR